MPTSYNLSYYPWITQHKTSEEIRKNVEVFAAALQEELQNQTGKNVNITVLPALEVPDQIASIVQGASQIALMNPLGFVYAREQNKNIDAAALALRIIDGKVGDSYYAQIYTHRDTGINRLADLRKRSIGYGSSQSTSNFIIPAYELKHSGIHPFAAFKRIEFIGGHDTVAEAVYQRQIDAGAGHDGAIIDLANQPGFGDAEEMLISIHRSPSIPSDPIAVNVSSKDEYLQIQAALISVTQISQVKEALVEFWGNSQGLKETGHKPYDFLIDAVNELGLTENDIFGK